MHNDSPLIKAPRLMEQCVGTVPSRNPWPESCQEILLMSSERQHDCPSALGDITLGSSKGIHALLSAPRPRNRSDKVRRRGIRGESDQLRSSREPVVGSDCGPWACVLPSVAGPPRADSHSLLPSTWGRLQPPRFTPNHPPLWPALANRLWAEVTRVTSRPEHTPSPAVSILDTCAMETPQDGEAWKARPPH